MCRFIFWRLNCQLLHFTPWTLDLIFRVPISIFYCTSAPLSICIQLSICLSVCLLPFSYLHCIHLSICLSVCLSAIFVDQFSVYVSICNLYMSILWSFPMCPPLFQLVCFIPLCCLMIVLLYHAVCLPLYLSICIPIFVYLSFSLLLSTMLYISRCMRLSVFSIYLSAFSYMSICPFYVSSCLFLHVYLSFKQSIILSIHRCTSCLHAFFYVLICLFLCVYLPFYICLSCCLFPAIVVPVYLFFFEVSICLFLCVYMSFSLFVVYHTVYLSFYQAICHPLCIYLSFPICLSCPMCISLFQLFTVVPA